MDPSLLHRLPESKLSRREFPTRRRCAVVVLGSRVLDDGIGLQVGQVSQLGLAEAMVAQALDDAADFGAGNQSAVRSAQRTGSRRRRSAGDDLALMAHLEPAVGAFQHFHSRASVAGTLRARQQLQGAPLVLARVVPGHLSGVLEAKDMIQRELCVRGW